MASDGFRPPETDVDEFGAQSRRQQRGDDCSCEDEGTAGLRNEERRTIADK